MPKTKITTIMIQPASPKDDKFKVPYPYFIDVKTRKVGRQDFWKGEPLKLVCFAKKGRTICALQFLEFTKEPEKCIGLCPVFEHKNGEWFTYKDKIASISTK